MIVVDTNVLAYLYLPSEHTKQAEDESLMEGSEFEVDLRSVLELVQGSDCSAYDCEFIALAAKLDIMLMTMDKKMLHAFPKRALALASG